jgi:hypothetical protein
MLQSLYAEQLVQSSDLYLAVQVVGLHEFECPLVHVLFFPLGILIRAGILGRSSGGKLTGICAAEILNGGVQQFCVIRGSH